jgi:O-antigen/teichoic acid export membrane protein
MNRSKKLKLNTLTSLLYEVVSILSGFVIPRLILQYYGSEVNGLVSSVTQFLSIISLCECGVGAVVQAALYKPLAENDTQQLSRIYASSKRFFNRIAAILAAYVIALIGVFPYITDKAFDFWFTASLILAISVSSLSRYYFGMTYQLIITSAQLTYIQMLTRIGCLVLDVVVSILLITGGAGIQLVKLATSLIFLIQPMVYMIVVNRSYKIDKRVRLKEEPIKQKWNGLAQHAATVVFENTGVLVLTTFSTLENVSVYGVYHLVTNGLKLFFVSLTSSMKSYLGDMFARKETKALDAAFGKFEWLLHTGSTLIFTVAGILIVPFVRIYTDGITDADYIQPMFGFLLCFAMAVYAIRLPYNHMVLSAGHFKQTQTSAIIEALLNIVLSVVFVFLFGLIGVGIAAAAAMIYRTVYFVWYLSRNILYRDMKIFLKHILVDVVSCAVMVVSTCWISLSANNYFAWVLMACLVFAICAVEAVLINWIFFKEKVRSLLRKEKTN